jgi:hypothetical protein
LLWWQACRLQKVQGIAADTRHGGQAFASTENGFDRE